MKNKVRKRFIAVERLKKNNMTTPKLVMESLRIITINHKAEEREKEEVEKT